ncbi:MAG: phosphatidic acid phosphatase, partial [Arenibacter sp.]|nr:phosphatidic acid phosphatase [Arenibacter sp.]
MTKRFLLLIIACWLLSCKDNNEPIIVSAEDLHQSIQTVTDIMVHDIFSPPVASRIFAYPNIAAYEIIALDHVEYNSLAGQVTDLTAIPQPEAETPINYEVSSLVAHMELSRRLIFSEKDLLAYRDSLYQQWEA